ncbi:metallophosphoesterase [Hymenobacter lutimineralis]|uniref:Metallophosphoesterase n=1 Tax=Hymenobacter lutimineralis TaxID=2606448 RepID=A0A5D6V9A4_9BACT|nr:MULTISPECIES: metallophosphoesterase [Hymenobacter]QIX61582.1 metallophosphoesterase [Hymenobacter sp. BT18]TYZ11409.1 metallophosphoesterase [Hymenobacter lutimineralis]
MPLSLPFLRPLVPAALGLLLTGCSDLLEFSPNDYRSPGDQQDLTAKNLARLQQQPPTEDTLRFVFTGDSQRFYDDAEDLVKSVNQQPGIQFMVVAGDISDFGLGREMRWVDDHLRKLNVPYLTVIGNHDQVGNGREAYQHIFGPLNYAFTYADTRFIMTDTNGREYNFNGLVPDLPWVQQQLADNSTRRQIIVSHVPPQDGDFDPALRDGYVQALREAPRLVFEMNGHRHSFSIGQPFNDGVTYVNSAAFEEREYVVMTVWGDKEFRLKRVQF